MPNIVPCVAAGCGLRGSEVFGLELGNVDFERREVRVRRQLKRMVGQPPYLGELKSASSRRIVELPDVVATALAAHIEQFPPTLVDAALGQAIFGTSRSD